MEPVNKSSKAVEYKMNIRNQWCFHMLIMKHLKKEIEKHIPLTIASKTMKYLGINLTKKVKVCIIKLKNHKHIERYHILCSWAGRINIVKIHIPKIHLLIQYNPYTTIPMAFSEFLKYSKICMELQKDSAS